ncbi:MAG: hypothetical protein V3R87_05045 [Dehalococcoidia bacterium]
MPDFDNASSYDERIAHVVRNTEVLRSPKQTLATFGTTSIYYYMLTEPSYKDLVPGEEEIVIREGRVLAQRPRVVTPSYLVNMEGFSEHARRYIGMIIQQHGPHAPGLYYGYKNEPKETNIVPSDLESVVLRLGEKIDNEGDGLTTIIKGVDAMWDVSLLKFVFDITGDSVSSNVSELGRRGLLDIDQSGVPRDARLSIEHMFGLAQKGDLDPSELKMEIDRWDLFNEYEDRFLRLFRR